MSAGDQPTPQAVAPPRRRPLGIPGLLWVLIGVVVASRLTGWRTQDPSICAVLALSCVWAETAGLERRHGWLRAFLLRRERADDLTPLMGALMGVLAVGSAGVVSLEGRALALVPAMFLGATLAGALQSLDPRRGLIVGLLAISNGTAGLVLQGALALGAVVLYVLSRV